MKNTPLALLLGVALAAYLLPASSSAASTTTKKATTKPAPAKEDAAELKSLQQKMQDLDQKISALRTDDTQIDNDKKLKPEARVEAIKDASDVVDRAMKEVAEASKGKKLDSGHAKSFNSRLHDAKAYLDDAAKKAKEAEATAKKPVA